jgi:predicted nucleic acid-binding protein
LTITADTNVLVRAVIGDEPSQAAAASWILRQAQSIAVPLPVFCVLVWVLRSIARQRLCCLPRG